MAKAEKEESMVEAYVRVQAEIVCALENLQEWAGSLPAPDEDGKLPAAINWGDVGSMGEVKRLLGQALSFIHNVEE